MVIDIYITIKLGVGGSRFSISYYSSFLQKYYFFEVSTLAHRHRIAKKKDSTRVEALDSLSNTIMLQSGQLFKLIIFDN